MKSLISVLILILACEVSAKNTARKPAAVKYDQVETVVYFGDHYSTFKLWQDKKKNMFSYTSSNHKSVVKELSAKDHQFLMKRISGVLAQQSNDPSLCHRRQVTMSAQTGAKTIKKTGCIGSKTPVAVDLTNLANSLSLVL